MTVDDELKKLNQEVQNEFRKFDSLNRAAKQSKIRMARMFDRINTLWRKKITEVKLNG